MEHNTDKLIRYIDVKQSISISLDQNTKTDWLRLTNKFYLGSPTIPLDRVVPEEIKTVHWHVNAIHKVTIVIRLYEDGSMKVLPEETFFPINT